MAGKTFTASHCIHSQPITYLDIAISVIMFDKTGLEVRKKAHLTRYLTLGKSRPATPLNKRNRNPFKKK